MKKLWNWNYFGFLSALFLLASLIAGCGSSVPENVGSAQQAITTTCTTNADCTGGVAPKCGSTTGAVCSAGVCDYSLSYVGTATCGCLEGDIQSCIASGTTYNGIQTCVVTSTSPVTTTWGTCATGYTGHAPQDSHWRNCSGTFDCLNATDWPVCGDYDRPTCQALPGTTVPRVCQVRLAAEPFSYTTPEPGCSCVQYDIRTCNKTGGGAGHQTCVVNGTTSDPNNDWGQTTGWSACS